MFSKVFRYLKEHHFLSGVMVLAITQFIASVAGLLRDRYLSTVFSSDLSVVDAYIAAFRPSDLIFQTCIMSALGTVLVPVLAGYKAKDQKEEMGKILNGTMGLAAAIFGVIALVMAIGMPWIAPLLVQFTGREMELYIQFSRLALLTNFLFVFGNACGQYLITIQKYWIYGITPIIYTFGTIAGTLLLTPYIGAYGPIYGTLGGVIIYVVLRIYAVIRSGIPFTLSLWHPDLRDMGKLMLPRILSLGAFQAQLLFFDRFASGLSEGSVTVNAYARNFQSVLVGVVGIAVAQSLYSILSQAATRNDRPQFLKYLRHGVFSAVMLTVPGAVVLVLLSPLIVRFLGLTQYETVFFSALIIYAISIPFESINHLQLRSFYALKDTFNPAIIGVIGGVTAVAIAWLAVPTMGIYGIALGYSVGEITKSAGLGLLLPSVLRRKMAA